jgi:hypothetical protein
VTARLRQTLVRWYRIVSGNNSPNRHLSMAIHLSLILVLLPRLMLLGMLFDETGITYNFLTIALLGLIFFILSPRLVHMMMQRVYDEGHAAGQRACETQLHPLLFELSAYVHERLETNERPETGGRAEASPDAGGAGEEGAHDVRPL